jgi:hypothetical protein
MSAALFTLLVSLVVPGQAAERFWWNITVLGADVLPEGMSYRLFEPSGRIELELIAKNEGPGTLVVATRSFSEGTDFVVRRDGMDFPVAAEWQAGVRMSNTGETRDALGNGEIELEPDRWFTWIAALTPVDSRLRFDPGTYEIAVNLDRAVGGLKSSGGAPWTGRAERTGRWTVKVQPPTTTDEVARLHHIRASGLMLQQRHREALEEYRQALKAAPHSDSALAGMAVAHMALREYRLAVPLLEKVVPRFRGGTTTLPQMLARAYMKLGDEKSARRVLRDEGWPEPAIAAEIARQRPVPED